jgi:anti-sigma factor RsiW
MLAAISRRFWMAAWATGCEGVIMGDIIHFNGDPHREIQSLLPWYATGRLDVAERAQVEAHLGGCAECQAELGWERRLRAEVAELPVDVEHGWSKLRQELGGAPARRAWFVGLRARFAAPPATGAAWMPWALAAQLILILVLGAALAPIGRPAAYRALGAAATAGTGNIVVIFRPDLQERALRQALRASHARLVDGPTSADAYVLRVPPAERAAILERLRRGGQVELAEPVDAGGSP